MEEVIRGYFDACNTGDADAVATFFAPGAVHYFPPDMYEGPFRGGDTIGAKWSWAVRTLGSRWTVDEIICDPDTDRAVIEWTHEKTKTGVVLRGDEWYHFDPGSGLIGEREYWAQRAAELGAAVSETWDTAALMGRFYALPEQEWLCAGTIELMTDVKAAGLRLGALTNDMTRFHGSEWVARQEHLKLF